jgi:acyl-CoA reductase-like NAD-dependent aldehyde dehydrogenase
MRTMNLVSRSLLTFMVRQAADPNWRSAQIHDPKLTSHVDNSDLRPLVYDSSRDYITSFDPATGLHIATTLADNEVEIANKIELAMRAQQGTPAEPGVPRRPGWRETNFAQRRKVIRSLKKWLVEHQDTCARVACRDTGKTREFHVNLL